MKKILLLTSAITLITASGCLVRDGRGHGEYREEHHEEVIVTHPVVVVHPPEIIVR